MNKIMNKSQLEEIKTRCKAATPAPWITCPHYGIMVYKPEPNDNTAIEMRICDIRGWGRLTGKGRGGLGLSDDEAEAVQKANAEFIANARKDIPALLAHIKAQDNLINELKLKIEVLKLARPVHLDSDDVAVRTVQKANEEFISKAREGILALIDYLIANEEPIIGDEMTQPCEACVYYNIKSRRCRTCGDGWRHWKFDYERFSGGDKDDE